MKTFAIIPVSRFSNAKTRLSPTLTPLERENLLKSMLKDVIKVLNQVVSDVIVVSSDENVLTFVKDAGAIPLKEKGATDLNGALMQAINQCSSSCDRVLVVPSDVPLIRKSHVEEILDMGKDFDVVVAPSKGGGTNALLCPTSNLEVKFGECSFFRHMKEAELRGLSWGIYDSFYMSLDVNTAEDLGEIMIHGSRTETKKFLKETGLEVISNHGSERLRIKRIKR
jgi:2-phospho-L-lactate guanylyltransferase